MSQPIVTQDGTATVSTPHPGGNVRDWYDQHVVDCDNEPGLPHSDTLNTSWECGTQEISHETGRNRGESDADFKARHFEGVADRMGDCPPTQ